MKKRWGMLLWVLSLLIYTFTSPVLAEGYTQVIPAQYDGVSDFREGLAGVMVDEKWGFIDATGKRMIPLKYDDIDIFCEGLAAVRVDGKWGFIDKTGKEVVPPHYDAVARFRVGLARSLLYSSCTRSPCRSGP